MGILTQDELRDIMRACLGEGDSSNLDGEILDTSFTELDFDSLAVLEVASRIQDMYRLRVPDDAIELMMTPRDVLNYVNERLVA